MDIRAARPWAKPNPYPRYRCQRQVTLLAALRYNSAGPPRPQRYKHVGTSGRTRDPHPPVRGKPHCTRMRTRKGGMAGEKAGRAGCSAVHALGVRGAARLWSSLLTGARLRLTNRSGRAASGYASLPLRIIIFPRSEEWQACKEGRIRGDGVGGWMWGGWGGLSLAPSCAGCQHPPAAREPQR